MPMNLDQPHVKCAGCAGVQKKSDDDFEAGAPAVEDTASLSANAVVQTSEGI